MSKKPIIVFECIESSGKTHHISIVSKFYCRCIIVVRGFWNRIGKNDHQTVRLLSTRSSRDDDEDNIQSRNTMDVLTIIVDVDVVVVVVIIISVVIEISPPYSPSVQRTCSYRYGGGSHSLR